EKRRHFHDESHHSRARRPAAPRRRSRSPGGRRRPRRGCRGDSWPRHRHQLRRPRRCCGHQHRALGHQRRPRRQPRDRV
ncbi:MAG: hypothetical protein AVDCRST_MAG76-3672, partial [uncultured Acidimicrobiales bacterium]